MENKMSEVAKLLGVELNEEFGLKNSDFRYKLTTHGLRKRYHLAQEWSDSSMLDNLLLGRVGIVKKAKSILDDAEKRYLSNIIKPFKDQVIAIAKGSGDYGEFINIMIDEGIGYRGNIYLPYFKPDSMYKSMKVGREYTLDQLGL